MLLFSYQSPLESLGESYKYHLMILTSYVNNAHRHSSVSYLCFKTKRHSLPFQGLADASTEAIHQYHQPCHHWSPLGRFLLHLDDV
jgi:hypothetical protein